MDQTRVTAILDLLKKQYPEAKCALEHQNVFQLLVSTMLSAQTTDKRVNMVAPTLYQAYPDAEALSRAKPEEVAEYIRSIGIYRNKSKNIVNMAKALTERFGGEVPDTQDDLESLPGVGRKTANVVLADGFGKQRIAVDTHVFRVSNRIGLAKADTVEKTEKQLMETLPENRWTEAHHLLIFHGRNCCSARNPNCDGCPIAALCEKNGL
ncbi:MAG: endonuclease III [Eubacteriales bacterium]|nr:endonuclease III [Eubacteriales bacterium]